MKKLLLATTAIVALGTGAAGAADMAVKARPLPPPLPACAQFGGFYVGAHVGAAYYRSERHDLDYWESTSTTVATESGIIGGIQGGYNWQARCTVFGFEVDASWGSQDAHWRWYPHSEGGYDNHLDRELKWFGTARTRAGVVVDNLLLYVTGGFAWANVEDRFVYTSGGYNYIDFSNSKTRWGFVAGVGTEWAWGGGWTLKSEFLYMQFADHEYDVTYRYSSCSDCFDVYRFKADDSAWVARVGINYIFGGFGKAPLGKGPVAVAAKY
jgi:outer membrane immunogenic protein